jgi:hypothetical protein
MQFCWFGQSYKPGFKRNIKNTTNIFNLGHRCQHFCHFELCVCGIAHQLKTLFFFHPQNNTIIRLLGMYKISMFIIHSIKVHKSIWVWGDDWIVENYDCANGTSVGQLDQVVSRSNSICHSSLMTETNDADGFDFRRGDTAGWETKNVKKRPGGAVKWSASTSTEQNIVGSNPAGV